MSRTPARGVSAFDADEEITGVHEGAELARLRARRRTDERIARLEEKHDTLSAAVSDVRVTVGEMSGKLDTVLSHVIAAHQEQAKIEHARISSRARVIVGVASALAAVIGAIAAAVFS